MENLLTGPFVYETERESGETALWDMEAADGVTVLTAAWTYSVSQKEYRLGARGNPDRQYVLAEKQAEAVMWSNLISWTE